MPELPEVETVKRTLNSLVTNKTIKQVTVTLPRIIQRPLEIEAFCAALSGHTIQEVGRRGKFLLIQLDGLVLVSHLRMEGRYGVFASNEPVEKHTHVIFHFEDGTELRYKDVRQFGTMHLFKPGDEMKLPPLHKLGIEPLGSEFNAKVLGEVLRRRRSFIKPVLLNQHVVVGLGNIYVDEALFRANIHPLTAADSLTDEQVQRLHDAILVTLQDAVEAGGSSIKSYVNGQGEMGMFQHQLQVYGREGEPCVTCGHIIEKSVVGGRGTHTCSRCQPRP
ncbi:DNA-formamidopyrimidine glycosylase [Paenibacillus sp. ACRRX]|uniref:DNA-formamidopyrimidine glycosylase n=1 Tax=unclassified Paenibacillus TaxID=185978 RepID=UPI001EF475C1|nr:MULTISPECIES: DNA-formamidopyrimidine glycosylase [unclassified Paenibacillus]MCG7405912.1 DNA-formamidopyrimidine glycosylase [Paenibacillus sp. ACRRX]MDK8182366.1 DNA-formamidopyrimidine glycosylase [Paenibacillus sp. UMB4589-SE434]